MLRGGFGSAGLARHPALNSFGAGAIAGGGAVREHAIEHVNAWISAAPHQSCRCQVSARSAGHLRTGTSRRTRTPWSRRSSRRGAREPAYPVMTSARDLAEYLGELRGRAVRIRGAGPESLAYSLLRVVVAPMPRTCLGTPAQRLASVMARPSSSAWTPGRSLGLSVLYSR